jgi:biopolymer transport protein ExbD
MKRRDRKTSLDMSSLMDIIFILLIFVMLAMSFQKTFQTLDMNLPKSKQGVGKESATIRIAIKENGEIYLQEKKISWQSLELELQKKNISPDNEVQLSIENKVYYQEFIKVSSILKKLKLEKVSLVVNPE